MLFTHVIFEVGAGPAQQEDTRALGVAVLAGQVQGRVPRLGERQEKGGHVSNSALHNPAWGRPYRGAMQKQSQSSHPLLPHGQTQQGLQWQEHLIRNLNRQGVNSLVSGSTWFHGLALPRTGWQAPVKALLLSALNSLPVKCSMTLGR